MEASPPSPPATTHILVLGATGRVGEHVVRELRFRAQHLLLPGPLVIHAATRKPDSSKWGRGGGACMMESRSRSTRIRIHVHILPSLLSSPNTSVRPGTPRPTTAYQHRAGGAAGVGPGRVRSSIGGGVPRYGTV